MKALTFKSFSVLILASMLLSACGAFSGQATQTAVPTLIPVVAATSTPTLQPTATETPVMVTATPAASWKLPAPSDANQLPTELSPAIKYIVPPVDCAKQNNPNTTCSTIKGQLTDGDFVLKAHQALVMTGDAITITNLNKVLVETPSLTTAHDLWVVVNDSAEDMTLHMNAPFGSFRGYFVPVADWTSKEVAHLRDLHLYLFLLPKETYDRFTPTPVPNCESVNGCENVNVRVLVFDNTGMHVASYGVYQDTQPFWQDLSGQLGQ